MGTGKPGLCQLDYDGSVDAGQRAACCCQDLRCRREHAKDPLGWNKKAPTAPKKDGAGLSADWITNLIIFWEPPLQRGVKQTRLWIHGHGFAALACFTRLV